MAKMTSSDWGVVVLIGALAVSTVGLGIYVTVANERLAQAQTTVNTIQAERDACAAQSELYKQSAIEVVDAYDTYLLRYPYGTFDLSAATELVTKAKAIKCEGGTE